MTKMSSQILPSCNTKAAENENYLHILETVYNVYAVIFEGQKFHGFHCKLVECKILILEEKR